MLGVYSPDFRISFDRLPVQHVFEVGRPEQAYQIVQDLLGPDIETYFIAPEQRATQYELELVHSASYLDKLHSDSQTVAEAFEMPALAAIPIATLLNEVVYPMQYTVAGVILATREALLRQEEVFCLAGGYHHAFKDGGMGFCLYSDVGIAVAKMLEDGLLSWDDRIVYLDLDAHMGNGIADVFYDYKNVTILDMFNGSAFPMLHSGTKRLRERINASVKLRPHCQDSEYLQLLSTLLPWVLDDGHSEGKIKLAIYNAGTDPLECDRLGGLGLSLEGIAMRDRLILNELQDRGIPTVVLPSGGYSSHSATLLAHLIAERFISNVCN